MKTTVIKGYKRTDMWDFANNKPLEDTIPVGYVMDVDGRIPESFIKYEPNKIFDRRKCPELYALFGKDHLPNETELRCFVQKHYNEWHPENVEKKKFQNNLTILLTTIAITFIMTLLAIVMLGVLR